MATTYQKDLLAKRALASVGATPRLRSRITAFLATEGKMYDGELMVVGRAVNGWEVNGWKTGVQTSDLSTTELRDRFASAVLQSVSDDQCPMRWVREKWGAKIGYSTSRSAFWRVIRRVLYELQITEADDEEWASRLVWTNLYKVAPVEGGNPSDRLCEIQLDGCLDLFRDELKSFKPKRILFLTGMNWAEPFFNTVSVNTRELPWRHVEAVGESRSATGKVGSIVVACHPQTRDESEWVSEVIRAFRLK